MSSPNVAIIDYGLGNLFSVKQACSFVGLEGVITSSWKGVEKAKAVILPGVGAFGDAMKHLKDLNLVSPLREAAQTKPFMGICLGMQLLMTSSEEFGAHEGLDIIPGEVVHFREPQQDGKKLKVPQVGWNRIYHAAGKETWKSSLLGDISNETYMYFVHSLYVKPKDSNISVTNSRYGQIEFCSSLAQGNLFACQYHPERSGVVGLKLYQHFACRVRQSI